MSGDDGRSAASVLVPGLTLSRLGFGVTGPLATPLVSDRAANALLDRAAELGIDWFDTGPSYGGGRGERRLGRWAAAWPGLKLWTKLGTVRGPDGALAKDFSPEGMAAQAEASLARLGRIDGIWLHGPPHDFAERGVWDALAEVCRAFGIPAAGVCTRSPEVARLCWTGAIPADALMAPVPLLQELAAKGKGCAPQPLAVGIEALAAARSGPPLPPRSAADLWYAARWAKRRMRGGAPAPGARPPSPAEALEAALAPAWMSAVLTTTTRLRHLEANAAAAGLAPLR